MSWLYVSLLAMLVWALLGWRLPEPVERPLFMVVNSSVTFASLFALSQGDTDLSPVKVLAAIALQIVVGALAGRLALWCQFSSPWGQKTW